jgi:hypothetical protein
MVDNYKRLFGESPSHRSQSPLESNDHPEINSSEFLGEHDIQKHQSLIGAMQWAISIGRFDIAVHVMTMSSFRASPRASWTPGMSKAHDWVSIQVPLC